MYNTRKIREYKDEKVIAIKISIQKLFYAPKN